MIITRMRYRKSLDPKDIFAGLFNLLHVQYATELLFIQSDYRTNILHLSTK